MLVAYEVALDLVRALGPVVAQLRSYSPDAADQVERAASSIVLNLAEGGRRHGRDPRRFWDIAHGSAGEIRGDEIATLDHPHWELELGIRAPTAGYCSRSAADPRRSRCRFSSYVRWPFVAALDIGASAAARTA